VPIFVLFCLFILNIIFGYFSENRHRRLMKSIFGQYVPPDCIDSMLKQGGDFGLEGEIKELTVLFADIRNFTGISEFLSASELKKLLNIYFTSITEIFFNHKGTIDKYIGDMVVAFWGAPLEDKDHALHGVLSAFEMQQKLTEKNIEFKEKYKIEIRIGIGLNTGLMNVGDMGSKFRRAYTVLGDAVNLAARLEGATKNYHVGIIVGEGTMTMTGSSILYRKLDKIKVKGREKISEIFEPICQTERASPEMIAHLKKHDLALDAYFLQKWDEAEGLFKELKEEDSNKALYDLYLARISSFRSSPPSAQWGGVHVFENK
jgi:adenylate cyclase